MSDQPDDLTFIEVDLNINLKEFKKLINGIDKPDDADVCIRFPKNISSGIEYVFGCGEEVISEGLPRYFMMEVIEKESLGDDQCDDEE
jgi:hypothetical protein